MLPMIGMLPLLLGIGGALAYGEYQRKRGQDSSNASPTAAATSDDAKQKAQNIYNYNGMNDSTLGRTLFNTNQSSTEDTNPFKARALFK